MRPMKDRTALAFVFGFGLCYVAGAFLCFNMLTTLKFQSQDAAVRSSMWMYTAWSMAGWAERRLARYPNGLFSNAR